MVTGTSVLGVTFGDGVMLAADTLGKFGGGCGIINAPSVTTLYQTRPLHTYTYTPMVYSQEGIKV